MSEPGAAHQPLGEKLEDLQAPGAQAGRRMFCCLSRSVTWSACFGCCEALPLGPSPECPRLVCCGGSAEPVSLCWFPWPWVCSVCLLCYFWRRGHPLWSCSLWVCDRDATSERRVLGLLLSCGEHIRPPEQGALAPPPLPSGDTAMWEEGCGWAPGPGSCDTSSWLVAALCFFSAPGS